MRQFLMAFACLSTLGFAQNVLAISPVSSDPVAGEATGVTLGETAPPPTGSMALLLTGLAGLTVAGRRIEERGRP